MSDNEDLYSAMYQSDEEDSAPSSDTPNKPTPDRGIMNMPQMSSEIRKLKQTIEDQSRLIKRLENRIRNMERHSKSLSGNIDGLYSEIDNKMDRF